MHVVINIKKILIILIFSYLILNLKVNAFSDELEYVISTVGIPRYNANGEMLNEEVYKAYNMFTYGNILYIPGQRWKDVQNGKWTKNGGIYNGTGIRGEYSLIGKDYKGMYITNQFFPNDGSLSLTPDNWIFSHVDGALQSWNDNTKYQTNLQLEYMKSGLFIWNGITYNLSANIIGLSKARLQNSATWKTHGSIYTLRRATSGKTYYATFLISPMAASVNTYSYLNVNDSYTIKADSDFVEIPVEYGSKIDNLNRFASIDDIKELNTKLYFNNVLQDKISVVKTNYCNSKKNIVVDRSMLKVNQQYNEFEISAQGELITKYPYDGITKSSFRKIIKINAEPKAPPSIKKPELDILNQLELGRYVENEDMSKRLVESLFKTNSTQESNSLGIIEAGQVITIRLKGLQNVDSAKFKIIGDESINTIDRKTKYLYENEYLNKNQEKRNIVFSRELNKVGNSFIEYSIIPYETKPTINSMRNIREEVGSIFEVELDKILSRKSNPYIIEITLTNSAGSNTYRVNFDVMDNWLLNINKSIKSKLLEGSSIKTYDISEWEK